MMSVMKHIDEKVLGRAEGNELYTKIDDAIIKEEAIAKNIVQVNKESCCVKSDYTHDHPAQIWLYGKDEKHNPTHLVNEPKYWRLEGDDMYLDTKDPGDLLNIQVSGYYYGPVKVGNIAGSYKINFVDHSFTPGRRDFIVRLKDVLRWLPQHAEQLTVSFGNLKYYQVGLQSKDVLELFKSISERCTTVTFFGLGPTIKRSAVLRKKMEAIYNSMENPSNIPFEW